MKTFIELLTSGIGVGFIYGSLALSFVFVYRASRVINLPAPELATLGAFLSFEFLEGGWPFWGAFFVVILIMSSLSFGFYQGVVRNFRNRSLSQSIVVLFGAFFLVHGLGTTVWGPNLRAYDSPFRRAPLDIGDVAIRAQDVGIVVVTFVSMALLYLLFSRTRFGLGLRAVTQNYTQSQLSGIRADLMLGVGWAIGGALAAISGMMVAGITGLSPEIMGPYLVYAFAAWIVGGADSPAGAVVSGVFIGVGENMLGYYVDAIGNDLKLPVVLFFLVLVLVIRPQGLWGTRAVRRV